MLVLLILRRMYILKLRDTGLQSLTQQNRRRFATLLCRVSDLVAQALFARQRRLAGFYVVQLVS